VTAPATVLVPATVPTSGFWPAALTLSVPLTVDTPATDPASGAVTVRLPATVETPATVPVSEARCAVSAPLTVLCPRRSR
jgi:hypothetical protein